MKCRTDFVTNSSSSSFILSEATVDKVRFAMDYQYNLPLEGYEIEYYVSVRKEIEELEILPLGKHTLDVLDEVYYWYEEELVAAILDSRKMPVRDAAEKETWKRELSVFFSNLSEEQKKRIAALLSLEYYEYDEAEEYAFGEEIILDVKRLKENLKNSGAHGSWNEWLYLFYQCCMQNMEQLLPYIEMYDGKKISDIYEILFDAKYLYYNDFSKQDFLEDVMRKSGICKFSSTHMG